MDSEIKIGLYLILAGFIAGIGFIFGAIFSFVARHGFDFNTAFLGLSWTFVVLLIGTGIVLLFQFLEGSGVIGGGYLCGVLILGIFALIGIWNFGPPST